MDKLKKLLPNKNQCCGLNLGCYEFVKMQEKIKDLEQELAEKEKELAERQKKSNFKICRMCEQEFEQLQNQTAIAELEKLKKEINLRPVVVRNCGYGDFEEILLEDVYDVIDNQIKQLKEMK